MSALIRSYLAGLAGKSVMPDVVGKLQYTGTSPAPSLRSAAASDATAHQSKRRE
jgi:hypothetical protein